MKRKTPQSPVTAADPVTGTAWHPGPMTNEDFKGWGNLPNKVVWRHFRWAFEDNEHNVALHVDDLLQEARLGLMDAWLKYNPNHPSAAKFVTYAYTVIHRRVKNTVLDRHKARDITVVPGACAESDLDKVADKHEDSEGAYIQNDFNSECLDLLKAHLPRAGYGILVERFRGKTFHEIGKRRGYTREHARKRYNELMVMAADILQRKDDV